MTMNTETKTCQNCKTEFRIEPEDFEFYEKISARGGSASGGKVPAPTFCPECRFQRRLAFINFFHLYKRVCGLCKKDVLSMYAPTSPYKVYCPPCWWSDKWDRNMHQQDYDFSKPFFQQFNDLMHKVPLLGLAIETPTLVNSLYVNHTGNCKNCYLTFNADFNEDCAYGFLVKNSRDTIDCSLVLQSELCYDSMHSYKNSRCVGLRSQVTESLDCFFLKDCLNCQNCFASGNLRNKKYFIFNKPFTKEQYFEEIKKRDLGSYKTYQEVKRLAEEHWKTLPPKPNMDDFSVNSSGSHYFQSKNCKNCFEVVGAEDSKFLFMLLNPPLKDSYDICSWGNNINMSYECVVIGQKAAYLKFCSDAGIDLTESEYCLDTFSGSHNFGSVGMHKGKFVIFNKPYREDEYHAMRERIIAHMQEMPYQDTRGRIYRYGELFPMELSPFPYNDTFAQYFFPLTKEKALEQGYKWRDEEIREYAITQKASDLPDHIKDAPDSILQETVECDRCKKGFKIIPMELGFLRKMNLPLPRQCPFCRIDEKLYQWVRNLRVFKRTCSKCGVVFETSYPEEEAAYILCKPCYQAEVV